jgi:predicted small secreted protein
MRAMMKKRGISAAFVAVLLVTAALITGCPNPESGVKEKEPPLEEGMGGVKISFNDTVEQPRATIMPGDQTISSFNGGFRLFFTAVGSGTNKTEDVIYGETPTIPLAAGTYNLLVLAYKDAGKTQPAASYRQDSINVAAGSTQVIAITLTAIADGALDGTFSWNITSTITATLVTSAIMTFTPIGLGAVPTPPSEDLTSLFQTQGQPISGTKNLKSGYYYVDFVLVVDGKTNNFRHILQVYQNMTSTFTYTFMNSHFSIGMIRFTPTPTYTHPVDIIPAFSIAFDSIALNAPDGTGVIAPPPPPAGTYDPYKVSLTDDDYPDTIIITMSNRAAFASVKGTFGTIDVDEDDSVDGNPGYGVFTLKLNEPRFVALVARPEPYQFTVTGTTTVVAPATAGKSYGSAEIFFKVFD